MKITGTSSYIHVEQDGKIAKFDGELWINDFCAVEKSMKWMPPHEPVTMDERKALVAAVLKKSKGREFQIFFE